MSLRAPAFLVATLLASACSRRPSSPPAVATPAPRAAAAPAVAQRAPVVRRAESDDEREERARGPLGESSAQEVMERVRDVSPYAPSEAGLSQLVRDVVNAAGRGDRAGVEAVLGPVLPSRERLRLVLTFEGDRAIGASLASPAMTDREQLVARAMGWAGRTQVSVSSATAGQIAQGADGGRVDPAMRRVAPMLRPLVPWYRVALVAPGGGAATVLESFVYAGGRWLFVPEPWRFAPGDAAQGGAVAPAPSWVTRLQQGMAGNVRARSVERGDEGESERAREREAR
jgi:hypothetical protein